MHGKPPRFCHFEGLDLRFWKNTSSFFFTLQNTTQWIGIALVLFNLKIAQLDPMPR